MKEIQIHKAAAVSHAA